MNPVLVKEHIQTLALGTKKFKEPKTNQKSLVVGLQYHGERIQVTINWQLSIAILIVPVLAQFLCVLSNEKL